MAKLDDLKEIRRGIGILFIGVGAGAYFGDLLKKYPGLTTSGEIIAFWSSISLMILLTVSLIGISFYIWRTQK